MPFPAAPIASLALPSTDHRLVEAAARVLEGWGWTSHLSSSLSRSDDERSLVVGGLWRLTVGSLGAHVELRQGTEGEWQPVRLGSIGLSAPGSEDEEGDEDKAMPFLRMWPRRSPGDWLHALWPQAREAAVVEAWECLRAEGTTVDHDTVVRAGEHLDKVWFGPGGVAKTARLVEQARDLRYRVESLFVEPKFLANVRAIRRGFPVGLGHLMLAWGRRFALQQVAVKNRAWLPLLNVIALRHWDSTGWQTPEGWLRRQAVVWDRHEEPRLPWGEGLRWHETDLPVFASRKRAQVWLARSAGEASVGVWGCAENVLAFEKDWARWSKRPGWPRKALPPALMGELQRLHKRMEEHLIIPTCAGLVDEAVQHWLELSLEAWKDAGAGGWALRKDQLSEEWERLLELLRTIRHDPADGLAALDSSHPWVVTLTRQYHRAREQALEAALPAISGQTKRERF
jgi:hypothetical protein